MFFNDMNVRDNTIDPQNVAWLKVWYESKTGNESIDFISFAPSGVRLGGKPEFYPFIDKYGQYKHTDWPGKVYEDSDFVKLREEVDSKYSGISGPQDWDEYGGWASGPKLEATGYFYATRYNGKWTLVTPIGSLFWSYGAVAVNAGSSATPITHRKHWFEELPARDSIFGELYNQKEKARFKYYQYKKYETFDFARANSIRKYGENYKSILADALHPQLRKMGLNTMAAWSAQDIYLKQKTPYTTMIHYGGPWITWEHKFRMPDVFNPKFRLALSGGDFTLSRSTCLENGHAKPNNLYPAIRRREW